MPNEGNNFNWKPCIFLENLNKSKYVHLIYYDWFSASISMDKPLKKHIKCQEWIVRFDGKLSHSEELIDSDRHHKDLESLLISDKTRKSS